MGRHALLLGFGENKWQRRKIPLPHGCGPRWRRQITVGSGHEVNADPPAYTDVRTAVCEDAVPADADASPPAREPVRNLTNRWSAPPRFCVQVIAKSA